VSAIDDIFSGYQTLRPAQEAFYQDLHRHPELSQAEHRTARRVADQLSDYGAGTGTTFWLLAKVL
jgi:hippurate hydrolase